MKVIIALAFGLLAACASTGNNEVESDTENNGSVVGDINILNGADE